MIIIKINIQVIIITIILIIIKFITSITDTDGLKIPTR